MLNLETHSQNLEITEITEKTCEKKEIEMIEIPGIEMVLEMCTKKKTIDQNKTHKKELLQLEKNLIPLKSQENLLKTKICSLL